MSAIGGHHRSRSGTNEWLTPPDILTALGPFDLDPCAPVNPPWPMAARHYTIEDNGLKQPWFGRIWLNPPYAQETAKWLAKLAEYGNGIALLPARTETRFFFEHIWKHADALFFLKGRLHFYLPDGTKAKGNSGAPSVLVAYDPQGTAVNTETLRTSGLPGAFVQNWRVL